MEPYFIIVLIGTIMAFSDLLARSTPSTIRIANAAKTPARPAASPQLAKAE
jgi:hypothetical protein